MCTDDTTRETTSFNLIGYKSLKNKIDADLQRHTLFIFKSQIIGRTTSLTFEAVFGWVGAVIRHCREFGIKIFQTLASGHHGIVLNQDRQLLGHHHHYYPSLALLMVGGNNDWSACHCVFVTGNNMLQLYPRVS